MCSVSCQQQFGHVYKDGAGRGSGEPCEILHSFVGAHGHYTKYNSPANREMQLERVGRMYVASVELGMAARMWRMQIRATLAKSSAMGKADALAASLAEELCCTAEQVRGWGRGNTPATYTRLTRMGGCSASRNMRQRGALAPVLTSALGESAHRSFRNACRSKRKLKLCRHLVQSPSRHSAGRLNMCRLASSFNSYSRLMMVPLHLPWP